MQLTPEQVAGFQAIYKSRLGHEISREQAYEQGLKLVRLMQFVYRSMTQADLEKIQKRQQELNDNY